MADIKQFNKGETIDIYAQSMDPTVRVAEPVLFVYPNDLILSGDVDTSKITVVDGTDENIGKVEDVETGISYKFSIAAGHTGGDAMPAGDYTAEVRFLSEEQEGVVFIQKKNHAFTLLDSASNQMGY